MSKLSCREFDFDFQTNFKDFEISNKLTLQNNIRKDFSNLSVQYGAIHIFNQCLLVKIRTFFTMTKLR